MALFATVMAPFAAPLSASAQEISCPEENGCGCCIIVCNCCDCSIDEPCEDNAKSDSPELEETDDAETEEGANGPQETEENADGSQEHAENQETEGETGENSEQASGEPEALIRLNELLPNPEGSDTDGEFIELTNLGSNAAEMSGWSVRNGKGKQYSLPAGTLAKGGKLTIPYADSKIALTNSGMTLELVGPDGNIKDSITYPDEVVEGQSYAKSGGSWLWSTSPTPGFGNVITSEEDNDEADAQETTETEPDPGESQSSEETGEDKNDDAQQQEEEETDDADENQPNPAEIRLSEIMPSPEGSDSTGEWIELENLSEYQANLDGWSLDDAEGGSSAYTFPEGTSVPAGDFLLLPRTETKLALNNGGDTVRLFDADGILQDQTSYDGSNEGEALALADQEWSWTENPTPKSENDIVPEKEAEDDQDDGSKDETAENQETALTIEQLHDVEDEQKVTATGVVTMPLGVVGKTIFGIRDTDADYGATVRIYASERPDLQVGDLVTVDGTVRRKDSGELRLDTYGSEPVRVVGNTDLTEAPEVRIEELDGTGAGLAVTVTGTVTDTGSDWFVITDDQAEREVKVELPDGVAMPVNGGEEVKVSGIVRVQRSVVALAVLDDQDIASEQNDGLNDNDAENSDIATTQEEQEDGMTLPFLVVGALGAGGFAYRGLRNKNETKR